GHLPLLVLLVHLAMYIPRAEDHVRHAHCKRQAAKATTQRWRLSMGDAKLQERLEVITIENPLSNAPTMLPKTAHRSFDMAPVKNRNNADAGIIGKGKRV